eukprot:6194100-Pleurochrysis_carterae.AAC.2
MSPFPTIHDAPALISSLFGALLTGRNAQANRISTPFSHVHTSTPATCWYTFMHVTSSRSSPALRSVTNT